MNFCFFFNVIGQKVLSEGALESLEKRHYETLYFLEMYFLPAFFASKISFFKICWCPKWTPSKVPIVTKVLASEENSEIEENIFKRFADF